MALCTVTGTLKNLKGDTLPNTTLTLTRRGVVGQGGALVIPNTYKVTSDGAGAVNFTAQPGIYSASTSNDRFILSVPDETTADISELVNGPDVAITPEALNQAKAYRDEAALLAASAGGRTFTTRAAFVAALVGASIATEALTQGARVTAAGMTYEYVTAAYVGIPDLPGYKPAGNVYPDHWNENLTPGTTNMRAAINSARAYIDGNGGGKLFFKAADYLIDSPIIATGPQWFVGEGWHFQNDYAASGLVQTVTTIRMSVNRSATVNMVQNATGASLTGWTAASGSTLSLTGGRVRATNASGSNAGVIQTLTGFTVGERYVFTIVGGYDTSSAAVRVSTTADLSGTTPATYTLIKDGERYATTFVANATTLYVGIISTSATAGQYVELDNVFVHQVYAADCLVVTEDTLPAAGFPRIHCFLEGMCFDGNRSDAYALESYSDNPTSNAVTVYGGSYVFANDVLCFRAGIHGFRALSADYDGDGTFGEAGEGTNNLHLTNVYSLQNGFDGFNLSHGDSLFNNLIAGANGRDGINTTQGTFVNCHMWNNRRYGGVGSGNTFWVGCEAYDNFWSGVHSSGGVLSVTGGNFYDNGRDTTATGNNRSGISWASATTRVNLSGVSGGRKNAGGSSGYEDGDQLYLASSTSGTATCTITGLRTYGETVSGVGSPPTLIRMNVAATNTLNFADEARQLQTGNGLIVSTTATTVLACSIPGAHYEVEVYHESDPPTVYGRCTVIGSATAPTIKWRSSSSSTALTFSISGTNLQVACASGGPFTCSWTSIRRI